MRNLSSSRLGGLAARSEPARKSDPYLETKKPRGACVCSSCHATQQRGRWQWIDAPAGAAAVVCPACRRIADRCPAHVLHLGGVPRDQRAELVAMVQRVAEEEMREHPLERLMSVADKAGRIEVRTTGAKLPRRLRAAIARAFRRRFSTHSDVDRSEMTWKPNDED